MTQTKTRFTLDEDVPERVKKKYVLVRKVDSKRKSDRERPCWLVATIVGVGAAGRGPAAPVPCAFKCAITHESPQRCLHAAGPPESRPCGGRS